MATWRTVNDAAKQVKVSRRTLQRWAKEGHITIYRLPGDLRRYVDLDQVQQYMQYRPREEK